MQTLNFLRVRINIVQTVETDCSLFLFFYKINGLMYDTRAKHGELSTYKILIKIIILN